MVSLRMPESRRVNVNTSVTNDTNYVTCLLEHVSTFNQVYVKCQITLNYLSNVTSLNSR